MNKMLCGIFLNTWKVNFVCLNSEKRVCREVSKFELNGFRGKERHVYYLEFGC